MNVLFVTRYFPKPETAGDLLYTGQMIALFTQLADRVDVFCAPHQQEHRAHETLSFPGNAHVHVDAIEQGSALRYLLGTMPKAASGFAIRRNERALEGLLRKVTPQLIVLDHIGSSWCIDLLRQYMKAAAPAPDIVYVTHNEETSTRLSIARHASFPWNIAHGLDALRIWVRDRMLLRLSALITCNTDADRDFYMRRRVLPAVVLPPIYTRGVVEHRHIGAQTPRRVAIVSGFQWSAKLLNLQDFLRNAAAVFAEAGVELDVIGRMDQRDKQRLQAQFPTVSIRGTVDRVEPYLADARMGLLIDRAGGGFKHSALTYAFNRVPIASLSEALSDSHMKSLFLVRDTAAALARAVIEKIDDDDALNAQQERQFEGLKSYLSDAANLDALGAALAHLHQGKVAAP